MSSKEFEIEKQYLLGNYQNALDLIDQLQNQNYTSYKINEIEALIHLKKNQSRMALEKMKEAVKGDNFTDYSRFFFAELLIEDEKIEEAIEQLEKIKEKNQIIIFKKIDCYLKINNLDKALENLKSVDEANNPTPEVLYNIARIYDEKNEDRIAIEYYERAIHLNPNLVEAYVNVGTILQKNKKYHEAIEYYENAYKLNCKIRYLIGDIIYCYKNTFNYKKVRYYQEKLQNINKMLENIQPFQYLSMSDSLENQLKVSGNYLREKVNVSFEKYQQHQKNKKNKVKIGYISADFKTHPTMHLMAELIEKHDKNRFEIFIITLSEINNLDRMTQRIIKSKNTIINISALSTEKAIKYLRNQELDIAIDLMGYTTSSRPDIFKARIAPIQINYLGYPGSMNMEEMDFIIADKNLIPEESKKYYLENVIYLPYIFQPYDTSKSNISINLDRNTEDSNKVKDNFIFACFNSIHKINENVIKVWAEILNKSHKSILWLIVDDLLTRRNLIQIFKKYNVPDNRIKLTNQESYESYLQNMASADLFLDTWPFNAGATCRDAIWAGLPLLTIEGKSYAARMSTSILLAANCSELVKKDVNSYIETAVLLSNNPAEYRRIKLKVKAVKKTKLFDMQLFMKDMEDLIINLVRKDS